MEVKEPDFSGTYTYADYLRWELPEMVELIRGKIFKMSPAPSSSHQRVSMELSRQIANYLHKKSCQVFSAPFDVRLPNVRGKQHDADITTVLQPDLCVVCDPEKIDERGCLGAPDWVIEILSKHTSRKDLREKFDAYEQAGVKEYWVVHPGEGTVLVYVLQDGIFVGDLRPYLKGDTLTSYLFPDLHIDLHLVFE